MSYALLFPGQGSQAVGMLDKLAARFPVVTDTWNEASAALGWDLAGLVRQGPAEDLNRTERTQPALLAAGIAVWRVWQQQGLPAPAALAGHSLGEYTALVAAGSLDFATALRLVALRGRLMQEAVPEGTGGMAAVIGLEDAQVEALCREYPGNEVLEPVNYNAPGQVVVAGQVAALDWVQSAAKAAGARMVMRLPVSVPSHCALMRDAAARLGAALADTAVAAPAIPVLHNLDARPRSAPEEIRQALCEQLHRPVRWTQTIQQLDSRGVTRLLECGPGKVLTGLNKRILGAGNFGMLEDPAALEQAATAISGDKA